MTTLKVLENRMRRTAARLGLELSKSRVAGLWSLCDRDHADRSFDHQVDKEGLTMDEVAGVLEDVLAVEAERAAQREVEFVHTARSRYPRLFGEPTEFDHIKLATGLREVMRLRQIGRNSFEREHTWRGALKSLRSKSYFNQQSFLALAKSDNGPLLFDFLLGLVKALEQRLGQDPGLGRKSP